MADREPDDNQAAAESTGAAGEAENPSHIHADRGSIAIGGIHIGGDLSGNFTVGLTLEQVSFLLTQISAKYQPRPFDGRCPYKGLEIFEEEDAGLFFGRERLVQDLLNRVKESRTIFITGPSGSGKSSLVRAGLIHNLKQGAIQGSERWLYEIMKPGREPLRELALAFSRLKSPELANYFQAHAGEMNILDECAESVLSGRKDQRFVLFIDQFEEVFTQVSREEERLAFLNMLARAGTVEDGRVTVLFAMRSDFLSNCATYPALNELLGKQFRQVGAMQPDELVSAIALPARHVGLPIEDELIARIINDMKGEPGALPLMQFALKDLFDAQQTQGGVIALRLEDYLRHDGIQKALERHADSALAALNEEQQDLARFIFSGLIQVGRGTQDTKRTALFHELVPAETKAGEVRTIIQKLADARLVITDEQAGKDTVTISHEKLIDAWPWLKKLVNENRDVIALQNEIKNDAKEWEDHGGDPSYLYTGARLANAREQLEANKLVLSGLAREFIEAGAKAHTEEFEAARQRANQLRRRSLYLTGALVAALIAVGVAVFFGVQSQRQANIALGRQLAAQAQSMQSAGDTKQDVSILLAIQSMKLFPNSLAAEVLLDNTFVQPTILPGFNGWVDSVSYSANGKYILATGCDQYDDVDFICTEFVASVLDAGTGKRVVHMPLDPTANTVIFSPDGQFLAIRSENNIQMWDVFSNNEGAILSAEGRVDHLIFSPDASYLASGTCRKAYNDTGSCLEGTLEVWETTSGHRIDQTIFGSSSVAALAFSSDNRFLAAGLDDGTIHVWDSTTGAKFVYPIHEGTVRTVAFSPDSKYVVSGGFDAAARVWETSTGQEIAKFEHSAEEITSVAFSLSGEYVVSGNGFFSPVLGGSYDAIVWEAFTRREVARRTYQASITSVAFSPNGKHVLSQSVDGAIHVWEAATGHDLTSRWENGLSNSPNFSPDGKYVISGDEAGHIVIWNVQGDRPIDLITQNSSVSRVAFSRDGQYAVAAGLDGMIRVWETATGSEVSSMAYGWTALSLIRSLAISPDNQFIIASGASGDDDRTARIWELGTGMEIDRGTYDEELHSLAFSTDGKYIVAIEGENDVLVWEVATGREIARMTHAEAVTSAEFSPDGEYIVSGGSDNTARVWQAATGKEVARMTHEGKVSLVAFSPDGQYVVSEGCEKPEAEYECSLGSAIVWNAMSGEEVTRFSHRDWITSVAFSPDGEYVITGSSDHTARVWESLTGKEIARMTHDGEVYEVGFSPNGQYVVSAGCDTRDADAGCTRGTARIWETRTGNEISRVLFDEDVNSVVFSPDGKYVMAGSGQSYDKFQSNALRIWQYLPQDLIADACAHTSRNLTRIEYATYINSDPEAYDREYAKNPTCPKLPIEPEVTMTPSPAP